MAKKSRSELTAAGQDISLPNLDVALIAEQVDRILGDDLYWFPVRHHSVAVARHVEQIINVRRPKLIFIEGPSEAQDLIPFITDADTRPPIAIYSSYRDDDNLLGLAGIASPADDIMPRFACWYPLVAYSPEYVAMQRGRELGAEVVFIDLPHFGLLKPTQAEQKQSSSEALIVGSSFYQQLAAVAGFKTWEETWDSLFEISDTDSETFRRELATFCAAARATCSEERIVLDGTLERERHFLKVIRETLDSRSVKPSEAMVVCGGFHLFLDRDDPAPPPSLPIGTVYTTVMPYSFFRISELSGYGAGNRAPQFYQTCWDLQRTDRAGRLVAEHAVSVLKRARRQHATASSADAIAIHQHAHMLAGLRGRSRPILDDIQDAIVTCCCKGDPADEGLQLLQSIDAENIGTKVGKVTSALGRLPLVNDFFAQLSDLDLGEVLGQEKRLKLQLDKREPDDDRKSVFLHRVKFLEVPLASLTDTGATAFGAGELFREDWALKWSPKIEPFLIEQTLMGETVETAVLSKLHEELALAQGQAGKTCNILRGAMDMDLPNLISEVQTACGAAIDTDTRFVSLGEAVKHLAVLDRYAVVRNLRRAELTELIARGFDRACFSLADVASAPDDQHAGIVSGLRGLAELLLRGNRPELDRMVFVNQVRTGAELSEAPYLRGAFLGLLAELRDINAEELSMHVSAYAKTTPDIMVQAGDFLEGVLSVSQTSILLGAESLVAAIDELLRVADWELFLTMLPRLRAAFERLHARHVDSLADVVARRYGLIEDARERLTELNTSVGAAAMIADVDRRVAELMLKWRF